MNQGTYFDFVEVRKGIFAAIVHDGAGALGNAGIIDFGSETIVFDTTQSIDAAKELKNTAKILTGKEPSIVINSHCHNDHVFGNQVFADATIISTYKTRSIMSERMPSFLEFAKAHPEYPMQLREGLSDEYLSEQARWELERNVGDTEHFSVHLNEYVMTLPTLCFDSHLSLYGTSKEGQLMTYGGGHSASDLFFYLPNEKVLFIGDLAFVGYHPAMKDGNPEEWVTILDRILQLDFETIISGHGPVGNRTHVVQTKQYLEDLISKSSTEFDSANPVPYPYNEWRGESLYYANWKFLNGR